ncbi:MAG: hypothetical protein Q9166_005194 [cf. Caloplaca sp. 2 TL-2023]
MGSHPDTTVRSEDIPPLPPQYVQMQNMIVTNESRSISGGCTFVLEDLTRGGSSAPLTGIDRLNLFRSFVANCVQSTEDMTPSGNHGVNIKVLDSSGCDWLNTWTENFAALGILHLRSPVLFYPCPRDRDGLLAFARETGRSDDCVEIVNRAGKSMNKHRRKKKTAKGQSIGSSTKAALETDE